MPAGLPTGTVTLLFTDIEGSTRLLHALGPDGYAEALAEHRRILREAFVAHAGVEVDTQGDAFFVAFPTATGAADAAAAGLEALASGLIRVRIGIHTGTPTVTDEGWYVGVDVHRGARVAALAHGGQVLLSPATAALLDDRPRRELGAHRLKDFDSAIVLYQLGDDRFAPLRTPGSVELPSPATRFLGREDELYRAVSIVLEHDPRVLTIVGPGGTGKTRFAIELARLLSEEAVGGTLFVPLAPLADPELALSMIAEAIGAEGTSVESVAAGLGSKRTHVVLDNLEQLLPGAAHPLAALVEAAPALRLLVTSREPLRIHAERQLDLPTLEPDEAVELFVARAGSVRADLGRSPAVAALCDRLDRLPLAIELAAARTKLLSPEALLERLGERLALLRGTRDADPRHATLEATIAWSYDLLAPDEQELFAALAVFPAGCSLDAALEVCEADLDTLASLLDKSLLRRRTEPDGSDRYWMLETIRAYAAARLAETRSEEKVHRRQIRFLMALARSANFGTPIEWTGAWRPELVGPELDNIRAALEWAAEREPELALALALSLEEFWVLRSPWEAASWFERLLQAAPGATPALRAGGLRALGGMRDIVGRSVEAAGPYRESLALYESLGDELHEANMRFRVGANLVNQTFVGQGDVGAARRLIDEANATFERLGSRLGEAQVVGYRGQLARAESDLEAAADWFEQGAAIARDVGWSWWENFMLVNRAEVLVETARIEEAEEAARHSLALSAELGNRIASILAVGVLAVAAARRGDAEAAGRLWGAVEAEESLGLVGQWGQERPAYEQQVLRAAGPAFERGRAAGRLLTLHEAAGVARGLPV